MLIYRKTILVALVILLFSLLCIFLCEDTGTFENIWIGTFTGALITIMFSLVIFFHERNLFLQNIYSYLQSSYQNIDLSLRVLNTIRFNKEVKPLIQVGPPYFNSNIFSYLLIPISNINNRKINSFSLIPLINVDDNEDEFKIIPNYLSDKTTIKSLRKIQKTQHALTLLLNEVKELQVQLLSYANNRTNLCIELRKECAICNARECCPQTPDICPKTQDSVYADFKSKTEQLSNQLDTLIAFLKNRQNEIIHLIPTFYPYTGAKAPWSYMKKTLEESNEELFSSEMFPNMKTSIHHHEVRL